MNGSRGFWRNMARNSIRPRELSKQFPKPFGILSDVGINLRVRTLKIAIRHDPGAAMSWAYDIHHVEIVVDDHAVEVGVDKIQPRSSAPVSEEPRFDVGKRKWSF